MKALYLIIALTTLFLMMWISIVNFGTYPWQVTAGRMKQMPEQWKIELTEENFFFEEEDVEKLQEDVLLFFENAVSPIESRLENKMICLATAFLFSLAGFFRERWILRDKKRTA